MRETFTRKHYIRKPSLRELTIRRVRLGISLISLWTITASAELILTAPPRESPESGEKVYKPLAKRLSDFLNVRVTYKHPNNWKNYERNMKNDVYDIVFDGPHFAAWRIQSLHARPLTRLPGKLRFVLVTHRDNKEFKEPKDLVGHSVCTLASPNLGALTLYAMFPFPARQPHYHIVNGGFREVAIALQKDECSAAILRSAFYHKKASPGFRDRTRIIRRSTAMTNQGITVSKRVAPELDLKIAKFLTSGSGQEAIKPILERFANSSSSFIPSSKQDYEGQNLLRDNIIFGW